MYINTCIWRKIYMFHLAMFPKTHPQTYILTFTRAHWQCRSCPTMFCKLGFTLREVRNARRDDIRRAQRIYLSNGYSFTDYIREACIINERENL